LIFYRELLIDLLGREELNYLWGDLKQGRLVKADLWVYLQHHFVILIGSDTVYRYAVDWQIQRLQGLFFLILNFIEKLISTIFYRVLH
jgi:hypothetical protein